MYEKILIPLDGSAAAESVLPYAEEIAAEFGSEIILVSVSESSATDIDNLYHSYLGGVVERVQKQLKNWKAKGEAKVHGEALLGRPADEILHYADKSNVSLIAMVSRGSSGQGPWLLGNIAAKVLRATSKSVLLIRKPASDAVIKGKKLVRRILVPLDGSKVGEAAIPCTDMLARTLGTELVLFQVVEPIAAWVGFEGGVSYAVPQDDQSGKVAAVAYLHRVEKEFKEKGLSVSIAIGFGAPAQQVIDYAEANSIDLIAMSTHGRSGIGRWVFGSVTDKVLHVGDTPVLVVRAVK